MGVYLCGGYFFMTQHTLDGTQVGATLKKVCGERVAEGMRTDRFADSGFGCQILHYIKYHDSRQRPAASEAQEKERLCTRFYCYMATVRQIQCDFMYCLIGYGDKTLFAALACYPYETIFKKQVFHFKRAEFGNTQPAAVHRLYHSFVPLSLGSREVYLSDYAVYLLHSEHIGQVTSYLGSLKQLTGISLAIAVKCKEPVKGFYTRYDPGL